MPGRFLTVIVPTHQSPRTTVINFHDIGGIPETIYRLGNGHRRARGSSSSSPTGMRRPVTTMPPASHAAGRRRLQRCATHALMPLSTGPGHND